MGCSRSMLEGMTDGIKVLLEPRNLSKEEEVGCVMDERQTFNIYMHRWAVARTGSMYANREHPVFAEHACPSGRSPRTRAVPRKKTRYPNVPPF